MRVEMIILGWFVFITLVSLILAFLFPNEKKAILLVYIFTVLQTIGGLKY